MAYERRSRDWSSYLCSSELVGDEPVRSFLERDIHRPADLHLVGAGAKFLAHRACDLVAYDRHRFRNRQARSQAAHKQFDRIGKLGGELADAALDDEADHEMRQAKPEEQRSEEHTSELQSLMRTSYAVFCLKKKKYKNTKQQMI